MQFTSLQMAELWWAGTVRAGSQLDWTFNCVIEIPQEKRYVKISLSSESRSWSGMCEENELAPSTVRDESLIELGNVPAEIAVGSNRITRICKIVQELNTYGEGDSSPLRNDRIPHQKTEKYSADRLRHRRPADSRIAIRTAGDGKVVAVEFREQWRTPEILAFESNFRPSCIYLLIAVAKVAENLHAGPFISCALNLLNQENEALLKLLEEDQKLKTETTAMDSVFDLIQPFVATENEEFVQRCAERFKNELNAYKMRIANKILPSRQSADG